MNADHIYLQQYYLLFYRVRSSELDCEPSKTDLDSGTRFQQIIILKT